MIFIVPAERRQVKVVVKKCSASIGENAFVCRQQIALTNVA